MSSLSRNSYGKSHVRLTKVARHGAFHELTEMSVDIELQGDFCRCYTHGDNSSIVATDTMKNTVYALAKKHPLTAQNFAGTRVAFHREVQPHHIGHSWH